MIPRVQIQEVQPQSMKQRNFMADTEAGKADFRKTLRTMGTQSVVVHIKEFGLNPVADRNNSNVLRADGYNQIHFSEHPQTGWWPHIMEKYAVNLKETDMEKNE